MRIVDDAIVLSIHKKDEKSAIISVLTKHNGLYSGYVCLSKKNSCALQIGNLLKVIWSARLSNHLGSIYFELLESFPAFFLRDYDKMLGLCAASKTLAKILPEREPKKGIYDSLYKLCRSLKGSKNWSLHYIKLELVILSELGFGLDLSKCPVSNSTEDLAFISPRSGKAISRFVGKAYQAKLFDFPRLLDRANKEGKTLQEKLIPINISNTNEEFADCLKITNFFFNKYCFIPYHIKSPIERAILYKVLIGK